MKGVVAAPPRKSMPHALDHGFFGRESELDALQAALQRAAAGQPCIVLLTGEPGIGKTRTAQQIADQAEQEKVRVLWGRCPEEPGAPPYWPWLQLIRRYAAVHDEAVPGSTIGSAAALIATLDAHMRPSLTEATPATSDCDTGQARFRLFDSIAGFWQRAAALEPLLLIFDDLHRADVPSLRLLEFVMAETGSSRLMVLGTYRDAEIVRQHPLSDTLAQFHRYARVQRLALHGFSAGESARFVAAAGVDSPDLAAALHEQSEGHPLFLIELTREMLRQRASTTKTAAGAARSGRRVPKGLREIIGARLNRLTPSCVQVLQNAAVIGREFGLELLGCLLDDMTPQQCHAAIEEARMAGLIDEPAHAGGCQFSHALVRDTLFDELPAHLRALVHQRIAAAIEARYQDDLAPWYSALAYHWHVAGPAGDVAKTVKYATKAAERARAMQAHEEAVRHYQLACAALASAPSTDAQRSLLLLGLGEAQTNAGEVARALATFADAAACARRSNDAEALARAAIGFGNAQWRHGGEGSAAVALIREALASGLPAAETSQRAALLSALCRALLFSNRPDDADAAFHEAVAIARRLDDPSALFGALSAIVPGRWFADRLDLRIEAAREALALVNRADRRDWAVVYLTGWHIGDLMEFGDTAAAAQTAQSRLATGPCIGEPFAEAVALTGLAMVATHQGRFAEAEPLAARAMACGARFDRANASGIFGVQMFTIRHQQGRLHELAPVLKLFLGSESEAAAWRPGLALLYCELGSREQARGIFEALAADGFVHPVPDTVWIASVAYLAEVCVWLDDAARAATLFDLLLPYAGRNIVFGAHTACLGAAARLLGMLATTLRRWDEAEQHFEHAMRFDAGTGGLPWLARSRVAFAAMLLRRARAGDRDRATSLLAMALSDASSLGMRSVQAQVIELQLQAGHGRRQQVHAAGLSARELQVLRLVAAGKTNQEIAASLCRSPATVAIHVRNILGKTHAANRAEAAAFAGRHGLLPAE